MRLSINVGPFTGSSTVLFSLQTREKITHTFSGKTRREGRCDKGRVERSGGMMFDIRSDVSRLGQTRDIVNESVTKVLGFLGQGHVPGLG